MSQPKPEQIEASEVERLIALAEQGQLDTADQRRVAPLLRTLVWLQHTLLETRISLAKLKRLLFGKPTEKAPRKPPDEPPPDPPNEPPGAHADDDAEAHSAELLTFGLQLSEFVLDLRHCSINKYETPTPPCQAPLSFPCCPKRPPH